MTGLMVRGYEMGRAARNGGRWDLYQTFKVDPSEYGRGFVRGFEEKAR